MDQKEEAAGQDESIVVVRKCQMADLDAISVMLRDWGDEDVTPNFIPAGRGELIVRLNSYFLVAESSGEIIGFIYGGVKKNLENPSIPQGEEYLEIDGFYVSPSSRCQSIGGRLLDNLLERYRLEGGRCFFVNVSTNQVDRIHRFFTNHRFKTTGIQFYYQAGGMI
jgi:ribosomal protein S18 acetylase RimI-like enzyme